MKILLVEDSQENRTSLKRFLERLGHDVETCRDGQEGWDYLEQNSVHLVLSDIQMPRMTGLELLRRIKSTPHLAHILVILFTGFGNIRGAIEALRNGAFDYLLKPIDVDELALNLDRVADYLSLKQENERLNEHFSESVDEATREINRQLTDMRAAYARAVFGGRIGIFSEAMRDLFRTARRLREDPELPVMIVGETGTGKELLARYIHFGDGDNTAPFVAINCAAINPNMFESELFGYEAGAFTGGDPKGRAGKLELARGGTLFLDEISEMGLDLQAKLLRVIQEREFYRVGGLKRIGASLRIITASNRSLDELLEGGALRKDLYYRLHVGLLAVPPLRERREAILPLARMFLNDQVGRKRTRFHRFSDEAADLLQNYGWPGNVRELRNAIERMVLLYDDEVVEPRHLAFLATSRSSEPIAPEESSGDGDGLVIHFPDDRFDLDGHVHKIVRLALEKYDGNKSRTADYLGITRSMLYTYLKNMERESGRA